MNTVRKAVRQVTKQPRKKVKRLRKRLRTHSRHSRKLVGRSLFRAQRAGREETPPMREETPPTREAPPSPSAGGSPSGATEGAPVVQADAPARASHPEASPAHATDSQLRDLQHATERMLEEALGEHVLSESPHQSTGNAYQTIQLGEHPRAGFRLARPNLLAGFPIENRSVCDLGANLGEISRDLRRAGASYVDAYEYDPFFTQVARYVTAYNGLTDIAHLRADVSEHGFMRGSYDICVGLSAFSFMRKNIKYICDQIAELVIIETHEVRDETWHALYVRPIARRFSHWCCFGSVAHGDTAREKRRLWLAFSHTELGGFYQRRAQSLLPDGEGLVEIDLSRSSLHYFDEAGLIAQRRDDPLSRESVRTYWDRLEEHERRFAAGDVTPLSLSMFGEAYWLALLCGIEQFADAGGLEDSNVYLTWMRRGIEAGVIDPGLREMLDDKQKLHWRVSLRLSQFGDALRHRDASYLRGMPIAFNSTPFHPSLGDLNFKVLALSDSDELLCVPRMDGHHRLFVLKLLGIERCRMMTIWDPETLSRPTSLARVKNYEQRMYQYLAGVEVDDPVVAPR
jgi:predicted nicotinamide N-methyase